MRHSLKPRPFSLRYMDFREIVAVDFDAGGCNVQESAVVKGKKKKGALQLKPTTVLCSVTTRAGKHYKVL